MVTAARFRKIALSFDGASEVPHVDRAGFRTKRPDLARVLTKAHTTSLPIAKRKKAPATKRR